MKNECRYLERKKHDNARYQVRNLIHSGQAFIVNFDLLALHLHNAPSWLPSAVNNINNNGWSINYTR